MNEEGTADSFSLPEVCTVGRYSVIHLFLQTVTARIVTPLTDLKMPSVVLSRVLITDLERSSVSSSEPQTLSPPQTPAREEPGLKCNMVDKIALHLWSNGLQ